ncbi:Ig-like domain-containing protein, partial [Myxococcota bacterium]|nr:Ig-like domain-containing protein [Myxococcota bacterium]
MKNILSTLFATLFALAFVSACGGETDSGTTSDGEVTLESITVTPDTPDVFEGLTLQLSASGNYSDGSSVDISDLVSWTSANTATATIDADGLVTGVLSGTATMSATYEEVTGSTDVTVNGSGLLAIFVTPSTATVVEGLDLQFTAMGTFDNGTSSDITADVVWSSASDATATITSAGLATGVLAGDVVITATKGDISGTKSLTVKEASLESITVTSETTTNLIEG